MARSNKHKYSNMDYVLRGKPGKKRWHKRTPMSAEKRVDAVVGFANSAAALKNRNNREKRLFQRAMALPNEERYQREKRRGIVRGLTYGAIVSTAVLSFVGLSVSGYRSMNANAVRNASLDLSRALTRRQQNMRKLADFSMDAGMMKATGRKITDKAGNLIDEFTTSGKGFVDAVRKADLHDKTTGRVPYEYGSEAKRSVILTRDALKKQQEEIKDAAEDLLSAIRKDNKSPEAVKNRKFAENIIKRIQQTNMDELTESNEGLWRAVSKDADFMKEHQIARTVNGQFKMFDEMIGAIREVSPDEVVFKYVRQDINDAARKMAISPISEEASQKIARGLLSDLGEAFRSRKQAASDILRHGEAKPPPRYSDIPHFEYGLAPFKGQVVSGGKKRPLLYGLNAKEKRRRILGAAGQLLNPRSKSLNERRVKDFVMSTSGKTLATAHGGALLAATASTAYLQSKEDREDAENGRFREALIRERLRRDAERGGGYDRDNQARLDYYAASQLSAKPKVDTTSDRRIYKDVTRNITQRKR
jgi:hypothetical protein